MSKEDKNNVILDLTIDFSLKIISYAELLEKERKFVIANQLLKSGTSIGANVWEAQSAESRVDFIHKLKISNKETYETEYWIKLCQLAESYPNPEGLQDDLLSIKKVLGKIISTTKNNDKTN